MRCYDLSNRNNELEILTELMTKSMLKKPNLKCFQKNLNITGLFKCVSRSIERTLSGLIPLAAGNTECVILRLEFTANLFNDTFYTMIFNGYR